MARTKASQKRPFGYTAPRKQMLPLSSRRRVHVERSKDWFRTTSSGRVSCIRDCNGLYYEERDNHLCDNNKDCPNYPTGNGVKVYIWANGDYGSRDVYLCKDCIHTCSTGKCPCFGK